MPDFRTGCLAFLLCAGPPAAHAADLEGLHQLMASGDASPVPAGWTLGGALYTGSSPYRAGPPKTLPIPGAVYVGPKFMFLGDRAYYTFAREGPVEIFGRLRLRLGNLAPADSPEWAGLQPRRGQLEAGLGAMAVSPLGLWTLRFSSDISGRSNGTEWLLNWSAPLVHGRLLVMPGMGAFWRSGRLANHYFGGVSAAEAMPGRPAYDVGNAWSLAPSLLVSYRIDPHWLAGLMVSGDLFSRPIRDSPLVQQRGRYDLLLGLGYAWR